jgi:Zn-dependent peptidase ImmA (M78 family)
MIPESFSLLKDANGITSQDELWSFFYKKSPNQDEKILQENVKAFFDAEEGKKPTAQQIAFYAKAFDVEVLFFFSELSKSKYEKLSFRLKIDIDADVLNKIEDRCLQIVRVASFLSSRGFFGGDIGAGRKINFIKDGDRVVFKNGKIVRFEDAWYVAEKIWEDYPEIAQKKDVFELAKKLGIAVIFCAGEIFGEKKDESKFDEEKQTKNSSDFSDDKNRSDEVASGAAFLRGGRKFVLLNASEPMERARFTLAHEIFHILTWESLAPEKKDFEKAKGPGKSRIESLADNFAGALLMPKNEIKNLVPAGFHELKLEEQLHKIYILSKKMNVSFAALKNRLLCLDIASKELAPFEKSPFYQGRKEGMAKNVLKFKTGKYDGEFLYGLKMAVERDEISSKKAASMLDMTEEEIGYIYNFSEEMLDFAD